MINPSIFTYLPPCNKDQPCAFLGFSRFEKEDQVTEESWQHLVNFVYNKVFRPLTEKCNHCSCCSNEVTLDETEVGIVLAKLELPRVKELCEISMRHVNKIQQTTNRGYPNEALEKVTNFALRILENKGIVYSSHPIEISTPDQIELNEFKVKTLCEMSLQAGIEKQRILEQVRQTKDDGYLSEQGFDKLQATILQS